MSFDPQITGTLVNGIPGAPTLYPRDYQIQFLINGGQAVDVSRLRCAFRIAKSMFQYCQFADITVYNLDPNTENQIMLGATGATISAGYVSGPYGLIFQGNVFQPTRGKEDSVTTYVKMRCLDGDDALNLNFCNVTAQNGLTAHQLAEQIAQSSTNTIPINISSDFKSQSVQTTPRGKTVFGQPARALRNIAQGNNSAFYFTNGQAQISPYDLVDSPTQATPVNVTTGMIGMPHQIEFGVQVRVLINPNIDLNTWILLNNLDIIPYDINLGQLQTLLDLDGLYRVIAMTITGDTRGNDWYYDLECVTQKGLTPAMFANG